jgi:hypothetical protein
VKSKAVQMPWPNWPVSYGRPGYALIFELHCDSDVFRGTPIATNSILIRNARISLTISTKSSI